MVEIGGDFAEMNRTQVIGPPMAGRRSRHIREDDIGENFFVLQKGRVFKSPSAAGKAVTGTATNGYRFWSIPDTPPAGQAARQLAAQTAAEKAA